MRTLIRRMLLGLVALGAAAGTATAAPPPVSLKLLNRDAKAVPARKGFTHTGGGNIDVQQPSPDTVVITMTGVAVAAGAPACAAHASLAFELCQDIEVSFDDPKVKAARLSLEGRVIGLLRSHKKGTGQAAVNEGCASVTAGGASLVSVCTPAHAVSGGQSVSLNDKVGPVSNPVAAGPLQVHQKWCLSASHGSSLFPCKAASAEFAPDPALDPLWISYWEPFHGAVKKDLGFQITISVADDTPAPAAIPLKPTAVQR